jgi:RHS repeat-associated protein
MVMKDNNLANNPNTPDSKYQYNGKEFNSDFGLNLLDYGARWYDPTIGRFTGVDPLADKMEDLSTYAYSFNNPISFTDPDGREPEDANGDGPIKGFLKAAGTYVAGLLNAVGSNSLMGAERRDPNEFGEYASYAKAGQTSGDILSLVQGGGEIIIGGSGTALATSTGVGIVATPVTATIAVHGATTTATALTNLLNPTRVEARSSNIGNKGERGQTRNASGTDNPFKKLRDDPNKPGNVFVKDANGKTISKKAPEGYVSKSKNSTTSKTTTSNSTATETPKVETNKTKS